MKRLALTGGIGSGKTTAAKIFQELGIPVYFSDDQAKQLMLANPLKAELMQAFGNDIYTSDGNLNRALLAEKVFNHPGQLQKLNSLVHPAVWQHFLQWESQQSAPYILLESAIIHQIQWTNRFDAIIEVIAPQELRLQRVCQRDNTSSENVQARINAQNTSTTSQYKSFIIQNNSDLSNLKNQIIIIHKQLQNL